MLVLVVAPKHIVVGVVGLEPKQVENKLVAPKKKLVEQRTLVVVVEPKLIIGVAVEPKPNIELFEQQR